MVCPPRKLGSSTHRWLTSLIVCLTIAIGAPAQTTSTWNGSTGTWTTTADWNTASFPNNGNGGLNYNAVINSGTVTLNQNITVTGLTLGGGSVVAPATGGPFMLTANSALTWSAGTFDVGQTLVSNGTAT